MIYCVTSTSHSGSTFYWTPSYYSPKTTQLHTFVFDREKTALLSTFISTLKCRDTQNILSSKNTEYNVVCFQNTEEAHDESSYSWIIAVTIHPNNPLSYQRENFFSVLPK